MVYHSERARKGLKKQLDGQVSMLKKILASQQKELKKAKKWEKYDLPGYKTQINRIKSRIEKTKKDIQYINSLISKYKKQDLL